MSWDDDVIFKLQMLIIGLLIVACASYITHLYFEYNPIIKEWNNSFVSPAHFWSQVPEWEWRPIWQKT
jgi:hypothetical protein